jgi:DNA-directed RNA polymerase subunit RPC12/RpoP
MKMKNQKNVVSEYLVNSSSIEEDGSFNCTKCGLKISPEDETSENYEIIDTKIYNGEIAELVITCGRCGSKLKLTGFQQIEC